MGDENPRHILGDYSRPSHEGYQNTIEVPNGNDLVPLRSDTIRLVQNGCSFHGLRFEDPNQHLKDILKIVDSIDLNVETMERTRTIDQPAGGNLGDKNDEESWALLEDLALYDNESLNDPRDFAKPVKAISMPHDVPNTSDRYMLELEDQIKYLMGKPKTSSTQPPPYQANVGEKHEQIIDKNMVELNNDVNKPIETSDEPIRKATKESIGEERKMAELPEPQPVSFYLNHKINKKLIGGLIGNPRFNDSLLAIEAGK
ncbi:hypothetical protein Tco_0840268 [Tanacetum coccineum]|uniref:MAK10-like protein n=1 Tax=Tanacetum coccineum TaxID=301880 RepID=A0ABQ5AXH6_9ASTR